MVSSTGLGGYDPELFAQLASVEEKSFWFRARNRLIVGLASNLTRPGDQFLEIGCGTGYVLEAIVRECGLRATGGELYAEGLEHARRRVPEAEFVQLDARTMAYDQAFDLVGAFDVLEHIDDDVGVLRRLHRAVRPGGSALFTVPQHPWLWSAADDHAHHVRRYTRVELVDRVSRAGFTPVRVTSFVMSLLPAMALSRWCQRRSRRWRDPMAELNLPTPLDRVLQKILDGEGFLIRRGLDLPMGGSLVLVARREPE